MRLLALLAITVITSCASAPIEDRSDLLRSAAAVERVYSPGIGHATAFPFEALDLGDGYWRVRLLTAGHVAKVPNLHINGERITSITTMDQRDIAVIVAVYKRKPHLIPLTTRQPEFGDRLYTAGFPMQDVIRLTEGYSSGVPGHMSVLGSPGSSGSPVLHPDGVCLGVFTGGWVECVTTFEPIDDDVVSWLGSRTGQKYIPVTRSS